LKEPGKFQFRAEMCNIVNHPNSGTWGETWDNASFGNRTPTTIDNLDIWFGAKLVF